MRWQFAVMLLLVLPVAVGCCCMPNRSVAANGTPGAIVRAEQYAAVAHDPYASNDIAPPIVGGRPRDYQKDIPEAERSQPRPLGWSH